MRWIDPPSGSEYGFPKPFDPVPGQAINDWLLANGYPKDEIDKWRGSGVPCRVWGAAEADPIRLLEAKILCELHALAGDREQAESWYRSAPIPALGGRTAQQLVESGEGKAVVAYLRHLSLGGFA